MIEIIILYLGFSFIYTFVIRPTDELEGDPGGKMGLIIDLILFWGYPAWDLYDEVRDWFLILRVKYILWKIKKKLKKVGVDINNAEDRKAILDELTKDSDGTH